MTHPDVIEAEIGAIEHCDISCHISNKEDVGFSIN